MAAVKPVALVTGGANGIGRAIAHHLLATGWRVGIIDLPRSGLRRAFPGRQRNVTLFEGDVREEAKAAHAVAALLEATAGWMPWCRTPAS
jgi:NAD(P)-dependent dehydrogenase (short-subunit alcohol dehydrogenase family)